MFFFRFVLYSALASVHFFNFFFNKRTFSHPLWKPCLNHNLTLEHIKRCQCLQSAVAWHHLKSRCGCRRGRVWDRTPEHVQKPQFSLFFGSLDVAKPSSRKKIKIKENYEGINANILRRKLWLAQPSNCHHPPAWTLLGERDPLCPITDALSGTKESSAHTYCIFQDVSETVGSPLGNSRLGQCQVWWQDAVETNISFWKHWHFWKEKSLHSITHLYPWLFLHRVFSCSFLLILFLGWVGMFLFIWIRCNHKHSVITLCVLASALQDSRKKTQRSSSPFNEK